MGVILAVVFEVVRQKIVRRVGPTFHLASLHFEKDLSLKAVFLPAGEFRMGRSLVGLERLDVSGSFWPPLSDCTAEVVGFSMAVAAIRPSAVLEPLFEMDRRTKMDCRVVSLAGGEMFLGDTPPIRIEFDRAVWTRASNEVEIRATRLDGQPTRLDLRARKLDQIETRGEWNLSGLDVTGLLARLGLAWSSKTDVGLLEFETAGDSHKEEGQIRVSSWVLIGNNDPRPMSETSALGAPEALTRPFRLSVPSLTANFAAADSEIIFRQVLIERPNYDWVGADPSLFRTAMLMASRKVSWKTRRPQAQTLLDVSDRHQSRSGVRLPEAFAIRVEHFRVDTGQAYAFDRPQHTRFALKVSDLTVDVSGPASFMGTMPNTDIRFRLNDKKDMRWKAITDFSTWPPGFRMVDVK